MRDFELREIAVREKAAIIKQGAIGHHDRYRITEEIRAGVAFLQGILTKGMLSENAIPELRMRKDKLERDVSRILNAPVKASALSDFPKSKRRVYEELIGLIYECSASQSNAKTLVDKILTRIK